MKKEYLILVALILISGAYLFFHKENKDNYTLPIIEKIDTSQITGLVVEKKQGSIEFTKKGKDWFLTDKNYLADSSSMKNILDTVKALKLSALVSQTGDLKRYELDDETRIRVKVKKGQDLILEFSMGKEAPSFNHTFVMLSNDKNVYHANGNFQSYFDKTVEEFRDKKVMEFKEKSIKRFTIEKDGVSKTMISKEGKKQDSETSITWSFSDGTLADNEKISNLLSSVSFLECEKYIDSPVKKDLLNEIPFCKIRLENDKNMEITFFKTDKENSFNAISSMNEYAFELSQFNGKEIVSNIESLLGMEKKKKEKE